MTSVFSVSDAVVDKLTEAAFDVVVATDVTETTEAVSVDGKSLPRRSSSSCWRFNSSRYL